jgi:hypothetical protein
VSYDYRQGCQGRVFKKLAENVPFLKNRTDRSSFDEVLIDLVRRGVNCCVCDNRVAVIAREKRGNYNTCQGCYSRSVKCDHIKLNDKSSR